VGYIQFKPFFGEKKQNLQKTVELIKSAPEADLLVLPELCTTGYLFNHITELERMAERVTTGKTVRVWERVAKETNTYLVAGICEESEDGNFYNSAVLIGPEGYVDVYRKIHLFDIEKEFFQPGKGPFKVYDLGFATIGIMICFDWVFPETARILALHGAEILCHPANLVLPYAQTAMLVRSIENRVFTITANRIGTDSRPNNQLTFTGMSQITSPEMKRLAQASKDQEEIQIKEIDISLAKNKMITANNHLFLDRKPDLYKPLLLDKKNIK
jgi:predicted amidohydrolase